MASIMDCVDWKTGYIMSPDKTNMTDLQANSRGTTCYGTFGRWDDEPGGTGGWKPWTPEELIEKGLDRPFDIHRDSMWV